MTNNPSNLENVLNKTVGLFSSKLTHNNFKGQPALFLDRDGVVIEETNYLHLVKDIQFIPEVAQAVARVNRLGLAVVMVTNQAGIGRGYYGWHEFGMVQQHISDNYTARGAGFDMVLACAYHAEGLGDYRVANHPWRKPNPGMLIEAARVLKLDLSRSLIIGDTLSDLAAGASAGLPSGTLVQTGHGEREWNDNNGAGVFADWIETGQFYPKRALTASQAIEEWLASL